MQLTVFGLWYRTSIVDFWDFFNGILFNEFSPLYNFEIQHEIHLKSNIIWYPTRSQISNKNSEKAIWKNNKDAVCDLVFCLTMKYFLSNILFASLLNESWFCGKEKALMIATVILLSSFNGFNCFLFYVKMSFDWIC